MVCDADYLPLAPVGSRDLFQVSVTIAQCRLP
jgi:hypothetical protein